VKEDRDPWLVWAERIDSMRVFPRIILLSYYTFFINAWYYVVTWFMDFDWSQIKGSTEAVALAVTAFPAAILGVLTGVLSTLTKSYWETGRKWGTEDGSSKPPDQ